MDWWMHPWNFILALFPVIIFQLWYCGNPPIWSYDFDINEQEEYLRKFGDFVFNANDYCNNQLPFLDSFFNGWQDANFTQAIVFLTTIHIAIFSAFIPLGILLHRNQELEEVGTMSWKEIWKQLSLVTIGTYCGAFVFFSLISRGSGY